MRIAVAVQSVLIDLKVRYDSDLAKGVTRGLEEIHPDHYSNGKQDGDGEAKCEQSSPGSRTHISYT